MKATTYGVCSDTKAGRGCGRWIAEEVFDLATAHAPGCHLRRSLLAKANHVAKKKRQARARAAAATRAARKELTRPAPSDAL